VTILAAETLVKRKELVRDILLGMLLPEVLLVLVAASVIWFGVRSGLRPLDTLRAELADRSQADLRPVTVSVPEEIQPVVTEVNGLLMRLDTALTSQRHFVSDAAHQLRTPIAALLAQVEAAQHEAGEGGNGTLRGIHAAAGRLGHLVEQLLALARAEPSLAQASSVVSLVALVGLVAENWLPTAIAKEIDLGFELHPADIQGNELLLQELLANLLDNALRHAGAVSPFVAARMARRRGCVSKITARGFRKVSANASVSVSIAPPGRRVMAAVWGWPSCARLPGSIRAR
jgi:two-component system sensor histidine kinase TctE